MIAPNADECFSREQQMREMAAGTDLPHLKAKYLDAADSWARVGTLRALAPASVS